MPDQLFAAADSLLLTPYGIDERAINATLSHLSARQVDDADLYFQYTRSEGWSLEEGIVKSGSFNIDQGVGVRAISGEKTAFAYSDEISMPALKDAAQTTRALGKAGKSGRVAVKRRNGHLKPNAILYPA